MVFYCIWQVNPTAKVIQTTRGSSHVLSVTELFEYEFAYTEYKSLSDNRYDYVV